MSSKTSTTFMKHGQFMNSVGSSKSQNLSKSHVPLSLRFSSATVLVSVRTLSVAACMSL